MTHYHPEDRPDPSEQPIRARVPEHVASGAFSTGVIVMTAQSEFILDFVQNLGRPHQIVARVIMPHYVLPQLVDAMARNIELYRNRWGELPQTGPRVVDRSFDPKPSVVDRSADPTSSELPPSSHSPADSQHEQHNPAAGSDSADDQSRGASGSRRGQGSGHSSNSSETDSGMEQEHLGASSSGGNSGSNDSTHQPLRPASVQEIYDDLKVRDEFLSGAYANAVMIGHGPHEFSFDFITNFYPHSAVSSRVFLAAGQIPRLFESLKGTWEQLRSRMQPPPNNPNDDNPFA